MSKPPAEAVCAEPKIFVGQLPLDATRDQLLAKLSQYGTVKKCNLVTSSDGRSKGCAMVLFEKWSEAEAVINTFNGTDAFGGQRALVVKFADPPKSADGSPSVGIAPKKLFVGQVPTGTSEDVLREIFGAFGVVVECHVLRKDSGSGAGCAFITYDTWAQCEAAIEGIDGKHKMAGAKTALVVRFANAKGTAGPGGTAPPRPGEKRSAGGDDAGPAKRSYSGPAPPLQSGYGGYSAPAGPGAFVAGYNDMNLNAMAANMGYNPMAMGNAMGMAGMQGMAGMGGMGMAGMAGMGMNPMMGMGGMGMNPMAMANMGMNPMAMANMGMGPMAGASPMGPMTNMNSLAMGAAGMGQMGGMGHMGGIMPPMVPQVPPGSSQAAPPSINGKLGVGMSEEMKAWKLFIGQVPFESTEQDLWPIFSPLGEVAELVVLKNQQTGKSKGCAFVTYTSRLCAEQAIRLLDGKTSVPGRTDKTLVVKYANAKS